MGAGSQNQNVASGITEGLFIGMKENRIHKFVGDQLSRWPLACDNFRALKNVRVREVEVGGLAVRLQYNPARMISSAAKLDKEDIAKRKCFLCHETNALARRRRKFPKRKKGSTCQ